MTNVELIKEFESTTVFNGVEWEQAKLIAKNICDCRGQYFLLIKRKKHTIECVCSQCSKKTITPISDEDIMWIEKHNFFPTAA